MSSSSSNAPRRRRYNGRRMTEADKAQQFFEKKIEDNPTMPRYNHCLGALADAKGHLEEATAYYRNAAANQPANLMIRNDYALHLEKKGFHKDALREYDKALLVSLDSAAIHMNLAAVHGLHGDYSPAVEHAQRAKDLNPNIPMNLRNLAKMQSHTGNSRKALANNLESIRLERAGVTGGRINTEAFRNAAKQSFARGMREQALSLIQEARQLEGKAYKSDTTIRTNEIVSRILARKGNAVAQIEAEQKEKEERDANIVLNRKQGKYK
jgi:tetratricopeptide (TPR) repeat protein